MTVRRLKVMIPRPPHGFMPGSRGTRLVMDDGQDLPGVLDLQLNANGPDECYWTAVVTLRLTHIEMFDVDDEGNPL